MNGSGSKHAGGAAGARRAGSALSSLARIVILATRVSRLKWQEAKNLGEREEPLARSPGKIVARDATIARLREVEPREGSAADAARRPDQVERLSAEVARLEGEVRGLRESTSWRITAPLRALKDAALRLRETCRQVAGALGSARVQQAALIRRSGIFEEEYYAAQAGAPSAAGRDPVED